MVLSLREAMLVGVVVLWFTPLMSRAQAGNLAPDSAQMNAISAQPSGAVARQQPALILNSSATDGTRYIIAPELAGLQPEPNPIAEEGVFFSPARTSAAIHVPLNPLFAAMSRPGPQGSSDEDRESGHYSVKGLLWQSLAFTGVEDGFRLATDHYMRHLVADGPFWHNYFASLGQWRMDRWSDGDDFLVDDIGHPMQGAVSAFIEIQNSPSQRVLRLSNSKAYWRSRLLAMTWATVFSTQQKLGPLGEAGLGNDGGFTYTEGCEFNCPPGKPVKYTNNTGWTDLVMTPVGGTAWVVFEDFLDREVSDRVQDAHPDSVFPLILRGALNPTRAMANLMRWRTPWYRDFQHYGSNRHLTPGIHFIRGDEDALRRAPRYEIFPHFDAISLPVNTATCTGCRRTLPGYGVGFAARLNRWVDFDSDVNYHAHASPMPSDRAGGSMVMGTFGFRSGLQYAHYALKASIRPGFVTYSRAYESTPTAADPTPAIGRITHFAAAVAINADYDLSRHFALRTVFGNTPVRYRDSYTTGVKGAGKAPYFNWLSHQVFLTNANWAYQTGVVLRF